MNKLKVVAKEGTRCPREDNPRKYISDSLPVDVTLTPFYRACLRDGSLVDVAARERDAKAAEKIAKKEAREKAVKKEAKKK